MHRQRRILTPFVVGLMAAAPACDETADPVDFGITLEFGSNFGGPRACEMSCQAYDLICPSRLSVRIANAEDPFDEYDYRCVPVPQESNLCGLGDVDIALKPLPLGPARIEIALWSELVLDDSQCLHGPLFDLQGEPLVTVSPQPAVAGAAYFDIGSAGRALIPMACTDPAQISLPECLVEDPDATP